MIGKLILIAALIVGAIAARQWWKKTPPSPSKRWQIVAVMLLAAIFVLAATGKLSPLFAAIAGGSAVVWKLIAILSRHLPMALKAWQLFNRNSAGPQGKKGENAMPTNLARSEALQILGLDARASREDIIHAHRRLMLKVHPDRGGSDYLAARINLAKETLLKERV